MFVLAGHESIPYTWYTLLWRVLRTKCVFLPCCQPLFKLDHWYVGQSYRKIIYRPTTSLCGGVYRKRMYQRYCKSYNKYKTVRQTTYYRIGTCVYYCVWLRGPIGQSRLSTCPLHTNSGCGKERRILIGPWCSAKAAPVRNYLEVYWPCAGGLSAVNAIGTQFA